MTKVGNVNTMVKPRKQQNVDNVQAEDRGEPLIRLVC